MSDWRCRFGWHPWGKWSKPEMWVAENVYTKGSYPIWKQDRICPSCGKHQTREGS